MFEIKRTNPVIPGYTGHLGLAAENVGASPEKKPPRTEIPGYGGFIPGIKAENQFGKTYGKLTYNSSANEFYKGSDIPNELRYSSLLQDTFVNQRTVRARTVAEIVGVVPKQTAYLCTQNFNKNTLPERNPLTLGEPLPGYTGFSRRVVADNVFGATYAEARKKAGESLDNISKERETNLMTQTMRMPPLNK